MALIIEDLHVELGGKEILHGVNLRIGPGEVHVLLGPNGCGKSTLVNTIIGIGEPVITRGRILFHGRDLASYSIDQRARLGLGLMFQRAPAINGLKLRKLITAINKTLTGDAFDEFAARTSSAKLLDRDLNSGFSGGEVKRTELLQLLAQRPDFLLADEPESGVDLENISLVGRVMGSLLRDDGGQAKGGLVITHTGNILEYINADYGHIMIDGIVRCQGRPMDLFKLVRDSGFEGCLACARGGAGCPMGLDIEETPKFPIVPRYEPSEEEQRRAEERLAGEVATSGPAVLQGGRVVVADTVDDEFVSESTCDYLQVDSRVATVKGRSLPDGVEIMLTSEALEKYEWLQELWWSAVARDKDDVTRYVRAREEAGDVQGYTIIAHEGANSGDVPIRAALQMDDMDVQHLHNLIVARKGATLHVLSSCSACGAQGPGKHYGVSEFFVEEGAYLTNTMIHKWCERNVVFPRSAAIVAAHGVFLSNYVNIRAVQSINSYPSARLVGEGAVARFNSIIVAPPGSHIDIGSRAALLAPHTRSEMVSRVITWGGKVIARAHIFGGDPDTSGHIECQGLVLSNEGNIHAIPEIEGDVEGTELSHEAAVGKIAREKIEYVMSRGLTEEAAVGTVIRGFLDVEMRGIPDSLQTEIQAIVDKAAEGF